MKIGDITSLEGKTLKGRNRIRENGAEFKILRIEEHVLFSNEIGPWIFVESLKNGHSRWIHASKDKDFLVKL